MSDVAIKLREARALLTGEGAWIQESFSDRCGGHCAAGALLEVLGDSEWHGRCDLYDALFLAIPGVESSPDLWEWNDDPERTQADVLAAFDKAISLAEQSS